MAITILDRPVPYSSAYGPLHWLFDSSNKAKNGFRFILDIYSGGTNYRIDRKPVAKRPSTGCGLIDLHEILRPYVDHEADLIPASTGFTAAHNYAVPYDLLIGEGYHFFEFDDNFFDNGKVGFTSATQTHNFEVGDSILIEQDIPFTNASYEGEFLVASVPDNHSFVLDLGWGGSTPVEPGRARRSDSSLIITSGITSASSIACGYQLPREVWMQFDATLLPATGATEAPLLTNCPNRYRMRVDDQAFIPVPNLPSCDILRILTVNSGQVTIGQYEIASSLVGNGSPFAYAGIGPWNIANSNVTVISGPTNVFNSSAVSYYVSFLSASTYGAVTEQLRIDVDDRCPPYDLFKLAFCDSMGSWFCHNFYYKNDEISIVAKQTYSNQGFGQVEGNSVVYRNQQRGIDPFHSSHLKQWTVRTDWLTQEEGDFLLNLFASPRVFWVQSPTDWIPIVLEDGESERQQLDQQKEQVRYEISFTKAYEEGSLN